MAEPKYKKLSGHRKLGNSLELAKRARHGINSKKRAKPATRFWQCYFNKHVFERPVDETPEDCPFCGHPVAEMKI